jgi:hypothetical protein
MFRSCAANAKKTGSGNHQNDGRRALEANKRSVLRRALGMGGRHPHRLNLRGEGNEAETEGAGNLLNSPMPVNWIRFAENTRLLL